MDDAKDFQKWLRKQVGRRMPDGTFEAEYPPGDPGTIYCRCGAPRRHIRNPIRRRPNSFLACPECDPNINRPKEPTDG
jgi:hypothetical protein